jgi:hypothetical protein
MASGHIAAPSALWCMRSAKVAWWWTASLLIGLFCALPACSGGRGDEALRRARAATHWRALVDVPGCVINARHTITPETRIDVAAVDPRAGRGAWFHPAAAIPDDCAGAIAHFAAVHTFAPALRAQLEAVDDQRAEMMVPAGQLASYYEQERWRADDFAFGARTLPAYQAALAALGRRLAEVDVTALTAAAFAERQRILDAAERDGGRTPLWWTASIELAVDRVTALRRAPGSGLHVETARARALLHGAPDDVRRDWRALDDQLDCIEQGCTDRDRTWLYAGIGPWPLEASDVPGLATL